MANRRMFSKTITSSSAFMMMPLTAQALYFHLGMNADDDGYAEHFAILRMTGCSPDDLKVLHGRGFVHVFDEKVLLIKDWKENNYIQSDRYQKSRYLQIYGNKELNSGCIQDVYKMDTQVRLGKDSIGKNSKDKNTLVQESIDSEILEIYELYPRHEGRALALTAIKKALSKISKEELIENLRVFKTYWDSRPKEEWRYIPMPATWFNQERWSDIKDNPEKYAKEKSENPFAKFYVNEQQDKEVMI